MGDFDKHSPCSDLEDIDVRDMSNRAAALLAGSLRLEVGDPAITCWLKYLPAYRNSPKEMSEQIKTGPPSVRNSA